MFIGTPSRSFNFNWFSFNEMFNFLQNLFEKKAFVKKHALAFPRQNVTLGKMLLIGKLELGKKLHRKNVT